MSKRCELQKEYYQSNGNYKGNGKYCDKYVRWLEEQILALRIHDVVWRSEPLAVLVEWLRDNYSIDIPDRVIDEYKRYK
jgi:hypothetical protein